MEPALIALIVVALLVIIVLAKSVTIVPQAQAKVIERLGRYSRTLSPGPDLLVPFVDRVRATIDLREQVISFPPQPVITSDNLQVGIDTVVYFQVTDPRLAVYGIANYITGMEQLTTTTLRNVVGGLNLEGALTGRDGINSQLREVLDGTTGPWGLRVARVEIKAIDPPPSIRDSMEKQMRADRDKRAIILTAEGARQSAITTAEGQKAAAILSAEGKKQAAILEAEAERQSRILRAEGERAALFLQAQGQAKSIETVFQAIHDGKPDQGLLAYQYLQTLPKIAQGDANKMWIVPSEFSKALEGLARLGGAEGEGKSWLDVEPSRQRRRAGRRRRWTPPAGSSRSCPPAAEQPEAKIELSSIDDATPPCPPMPHAAAAVPGHRGGPGRRQHRRPIPDRETSRPPPRLDRAQSLVAAARRWTVQGVLRSVLEQAFAELGQRLAEQPGHVHLRDADVGGDLRLGHVPEEPQDQDAALAGRDGGQQRLQRLAVLHALERGVLLAQRGGEGGGVVLARRAARPASCCGRRWRRRDPRAPRRAGCRRCSASSDGVGARPFFCASSPTAAFSDRCSSCSRRGTRTDQPWSRKCRLISPVIVGTAKERNSTPRVGSNRSMAAISPSVPTCSRSSNGSPRLLNRRAKCRTRGRCSSTRISRSRSRRGSSFSRVASSANSGAVRSARRRLSEIGGGVGDGARRRGGLDGLGRRRSRLRASAATSGSLPGCRALGTSTGGSAAGRRPPTADRGTARPRGGCRRCAGRPGHRATERF